MKYKFFLTFQEIQDIRDALAEITEQNYDDDLIQRWNALFDRFNRFMGGLT